jgi:acyl-CoA thioester hydrolase
MSVDAALLTGYPVIVELPVAWGDMDSYRHVNNVVYFRYFENARLEYFGRLDWFEYEKETGIGPILAATHARFRKPLTYPDFISVGCRIAKVEQDRFQMEYCLVSHRLNAVAADGGGTVVTFHYVDGKKIAVPVAIRLRIEKLEGKVFPS